MIQIFRMSMILESIWFL